MEKMQDRAVATEVVTGSWEDPPAR